MAFIIKNAMAKHITDIIPHSNRITEMRIAGSAPVTILNIYAPQSGRTKEEKDAFHQELRNIIKKIPKKGPYLIIGDWNAKVQEADTEEEQQWIGEHTFCKGTETTWQQTEGVEENREALLEHCREFTLAICNTRFCKPDFKLATWRTMGTTKEHPLCRQSYDQIDYILTPKRWQNGIKDVESDLKANIDSDHAPVWAKCHFKLKRIAQGQHTMRQRVDPIEDHRKEEFNQELMRRFQE